MRRKNLAFFKKNVTKDGYIDYYFTIDNEGQDELIKEPDIGEQGIVAVPQIVYDIKNKTLGIKRIFIWNEDWIILSRDKYANLYRLVEKFVKSYDEGRW